MHDVARLAGVSLKTVSRVVNAESGVRADTERRVRTAIDELGFRRNLGASHLRRGTSTGTIGVLLEDLANPCYATLTRAVEEVARRSGRHVLAGSSDEDPDRERELALDFCSRRVDGLVVVPAGGPHDYLVPEIEAGLPVVFVDRPADGVAADTVLVDNAGGARAAVDHLAAHGHERIGFLGDTPSIYTAAQRLRGFLAGRDGEFVAMGPHDETTVERSLHEFLDRPRPATALVTGNNRITVLVLRALAARRNRPALVGFDDFELADLMSPPVTVISHDTPLLGRTAAELLAARIAGDDTPPRRVTVPARLIA
ncbi:MAG TPA: LacI family DNA-binding transcriptional regulator, partial [Pseudonocardiaceae bacterium]|nr:LacI family DNA-binding transcriptional regulator [Pseudonocardiaceae bacterium]